MSSGIPGKDNETEVGNIPEEIMGTHFPNLMKAAH